MSQTDDTCVRCREREVAGPLSLCVTCAAETKAEFSRGLARMGEYLRAWAAFDEWLRAHGRYAG